VHPAQEIVEQALMASFLYERAQRTGGEWRQIDRHQLRGDAAADERHQPGILRCSYRFGQQPQRKAREIFAALAVAQPVGDERAEIDLPQFCFDGRGFEEMHLDEFAELVGDALLIALDDRGVRDRQPQRPFEQRYHGVPVGQTADGGGFGKGRNEAEHRMYWQQRLRAEENRKRRRQHRCRQQLHAPQLGGAGGVAGRVDDEGAGKRHDGFRVVNSNSNASRSTCPGRGAALRCEASPASPAGTIVIPDDAKRRSGISRFRVRASHAPE
jgi:hypothetical protein